MADEVNGEASELEAKVGDKSIRLKTKQMAEFVSLLLIIVVGVMTVLFWQHMKQTDEVFRELVLTNKQMVEAQREMNCLIAMPAEKREGEYNSQWGLCRRISR